MRKIDFRTIHAETKENYERIYNIDKKSIGTEKYQGLAWFHNYEYRHLLRSLSDYKGWKQKNRPRKPWNILYKKIHDEFIKNNLDTGGFSVHHTKIIETVLGFDENHLVNIYHKEIQK